MASVQSSQPHYHYGDKDPLALADRYPIVSPQDSGQGTAVDMSLTYLLKT